MSARPCARMRSGEGNLFPSEAPGRNPAAAAEQLHGRAVERAFASALQRIGRLKKGPIQSVGEGIPVPGTGGLTEVRDDSAFPHATN